MARISALNDKVEAWWSFEEASKSEEYVDLKSGIRLVNPVTPRNLNQVTGVVGQGIDTAEWPDYLINNTGKRLRLSHEDFSVCGWFQLPGAPADDQFIVGAWDSTANSVEFQVALIGYATHPSMTLQIKVGDGATFDDITGTFTDTGGWVFFCFNWYDQRHLGIRGGQAQLRLTQNIIDETEIVQNLEEEHLRTNMPISMFADENGKVLNHDNLDTVVRVDELVFFNETLTKAEQDWLYNSGNGRAYADIPTADAELQADCAKEIKCAPPDDYSYDAATAAQDAGTCGNEIDCCEGDDYAYVSDADIASGALNELGLPPKGLDACAENPDIIFSPAPGTCVAFPVFVGLRSDTEGTDILYTTDGSDPETSVQGTTLKYTGTPITISSTIESIRARPVISGCPTYPVITGTWNSCIFFEFTFLCPTTDKVGAFNVWTADGGDDHNWNLNITFASATTIERIEIYELDESLQWTTGQAWATDNPIYPHEDDPTKPFTVYPLKVEESGVPFHTAYVAQFGTGFTGAKTWVLYGDIRQIAPSNHYFQIKIFTAESGQLTSIIGAGACDTPPVVCPGPLMTLATGCDTGAAYVDITLTNPHSNPMDYTLAHERRCLGETFPITISEGTVPASSNLVVRDTPLPNDCVVCYTGFTQEQAPGVCQAGLSRLCITTPCAPAVGITVQDSMIVEGNNTTFTVTTTCVDGVAPCASGIPLYLDGSFVSPWQTATPSNGVATVVAGSGLSPGDHTITARACGCDTTVDAEVDINVEGLAQPCTGNGFNIRLVEVNGGSNLTFLNINTTDPPGPNFGCSGASSGSPWKGDMLAISGGCGYTIPTDNNGSYIETNQGIKTKITVLMQASWLSPGTLNTINTLSDCSGPPNVTGWWIILFACRTDGERYRVWTGYKQGAETPIGTYTFLKDLCTGGVHAPTVSWLDTPQLPATLTFELSPTP